MNDLEHCCICSARAEYIQRTLCRDGSAHGWQELPKVYQDRAYCVSHFFLQDEHTREWTAQQVAREASRATLDDIKRQGLEGEPYQPV